MRITGFDNSTLFLIAILALAHEASANMCKDIPGQSVNTPITSSVGTPKATIIDYMLRSTQSYSPFLEALDKVLYRRTHGPLVIHAGISAEQFSQRYSNPSTFLKRSVLVMLLLEKGDRDSLQPLLDLVKGSPDRETTAQFFQRFADARISFKLAADVLNFHSENSRLITELFDRNDLGLVPLLELGMLSSSDKAKLLQLHSRDDLNRYWDIATKARDSLVNLYFMIEEISGKSIRNFSKDDRFEDFSKVLSKAPHPIELLRKINVLNDGSTQIQIAGSDSSTQELEALKSIQTMVNQTAHLDTEAAWKKTIEQNHLPNLILALDTGLAIQGRNAARLVSTRNVLVHPSLRPFIQAGSARKIFSNYSLRSRIGTRYHSLAYALGYNYINFGIFSVDAKAYAKHLKLIVDLMPNLSADQVREILELGEGKISTLTSATWGDGLTTRDIIFGLYNFATLGENSRQIISENYLRNRLPALGKDRERAQMPQRELSESELDQIKDALLSHRHVWGTGIYRIGGFSVSVTFDPILLENASSAALIKALLQSKEDGPVVAANVARYVENLVTEAQAASPAFQKLLAEVLSQYGDLFVTTWQGETKTDGQLLKNIFAKLKRSY